MKLFVNYEVMAGPKVGSLEDSYRSNLDYEASTLPYLRCNYQQDEEIKGEQSVLLYSRDNLSHHKTSSHRVDKAFPGCNLLVVVIPKSIKNPFIAKKVINDNLEFVGNTIS